MAIVRGDAPPATVVPTQTIPDLKPPAIMGRPMKFKTPEDLQKQIDKYFAYCDPHIEEYDMPLFVKEEHNEAGGYYRTVRAQQISQRRPYTISGLAVFLDTSRDVLLDYERLADKDPEDLPEHLRGDKKFLQDFSNTIKRAKMRVHGFVEEKLLGGGHPAGPIFNLKNNFSNWEDRTVVDDPAAAEMRKQLDELRTTMADRIKKNKKRA